VEQLRIPLGAGVTGWVAAYRGTIRRADAALDLGSLAVTLRVRGCVSSPLFVLGELRGVLTVYTSDAADLSDDLAGTIGSLAQEIGLLLAHEPPDRTSTDPRPALIVPIAATRPFAAARN
jgi:putative methionine-R-sulfoxide reductase with GAF domain